MRRRSWRTGAPADSGNGAFQNSPAANRRQIPPEAPFCPLKREQVDEMAAHARARAPNLAPIVEALRRGVGSLPVT